MSGHPGIPALRSSVPVFWNSKYEAEHWVSAPCVQSGDLDIAFLPEGIRGKRKIEMIEAAKACCARCPSQLKRECLDRAIAQNDVYGIFGGLTPEERRAIVEKRAREAAAASPAPRAWTADEDALILAGELSGKEIAKRTGRSLRSVYLRAERIRARERAS